MEPILSVEHLSVSYGNVAAVHDVSFSLGTSCVLGMVGESGSGKTSIARAMLGILPSAARVTGSIRFCGKDVLQMHDTARRALLGRSITMVSQDPRTSFSPVRTIGSQFVQLLRMQGVSKACARKQACSLLEVMHVSEPDRVMKRYAGELSGGECQRVALAMALALKPRLLIADEPTSALDTVSQAQAIAELASVRDELGCAILCITHNIALLFKLANYICVVQNGSLVEYASARALQEHPQHSYTQELLRAIPRIDPGVHTCNKEALSCTLDGSGGHRSDVLRTSSAAVSCVLDGSGDADNLGRKELSSVGVSCPCSR